MKNFIFILIICFMSLSCDNNRISLVKPVSKNKSFVKKEIKKEISKQIVMKKTNFGQTEISFELPENYKVSTTAVDSIFYKTECIETGIKSWELPSIISITNFLKPNNAAYEVSSFLQSELELLKNYKDFKIIEQGTSSILNEKAQFVIYEYQDCFPPDKVPLIKITRKISITYVMYNNNIYKFEYSSSNKNYDLNKPIYDRFEKSINLK